MQEKTRTKLDNDTEVGLQYNSPMPKLEYNVLVLLLY